MTQSALSSVLLVLTFPDLNPVAIAIGPIQVRWYGLAYMAGLLFGWCYIRNLVGAPQRWGNASPPFPPAAVDDLLLYMTIGVIVGGRLGQVLLYEPGAYYRDPLEIFRLWHGGMAFHGALLASVLAIYMFAERYHTSFLSTMDLCAAAMPVGQLLGRLANFINGELWGRPTDVPWAMVFPSAARDFPDLEPIGRHPSQLYEAAIEGLLLFAVLRYMTHQRGSLRYPGLTTGIFVVGMAVARSFCEMFREPDVVRLLSSISLTPGQAYSLPMGLLGLHLMARSRRKRPEAADRS